MGCCFFKSDYDVFPKEKIPNSLNDIEVTDIDGKVNKLESYLDNKKAALFVNVACDWGLTSSNYKQLVEIFDEYQSQGLQILAFPCGQFFGQEKTYNNEIKSYVESKFKVKFPLFSKSEVNGPMTNKVYLYLKSNSSLNHETKGLRNIPWNFSKFLVDVKTNQIRFYNPNTSPKTILSEIKKILA